MQHQRRLRFESLEKRRMLAAEIVWVNEFGTGANSPDFDIVYEENQAIARALVNRAIIDWEGVIESFNYNDPLLNDTYTLTITAGPDFNDDVAGRGGPDPFNFAAGEKPRSGSINMDDNGGGEGWFFDQTALDTSSAQVYSTYKRETLAPASGITHSRGAAVLLFFRY